MSNMVVVVVEIDIPENESQEESIWNVGQVVENLKIALKDKYNARRISMVINETAEELVGVLYPTDTAETRTEQFNNSSN